MRQFWELLALACVAALGFDFAWIQGYPLSAYIFAAEIVMAGGVALVCT
jgi:hypothetical protein